MPDLNHSQVEARDHFGSNLLILAGAGAGKTETIAARALNIAGLEGSTGLTLITFTKKAALSVKCFDIKDEFLGEYNLGNVCWNKANQ